MNVSCLKVKCLSEKPAEAFFQSQNLNHNISVTSAHVLDSLITTPHCVLILYLLIITILHKLLCKIYMVKLSLMKTQYAFYMMTDSRQKVLPFPETQLSTSYKIFMVFLNVGCLVWTSDHLWNLLGYSMSHTNIHHHCVWSIRCFGVYTHVPTCSCISCTALCAVLELFHIHDQSTTRGVFIWAYTHHLWIHFITAIWGALFHF